MRQLASSGNLLLGEIFLITMWIVYLARMLMSDGHGVANDEGIAGDRLLTTRGLLVTMGMLIAHTAKTLQTL